jgi:hypothetical protein
MKAKKVTVSSANENIREPYASPVFCVYGALEKLTQMPGGSIQCEGNSGKPHKKIRPNQPPGPPC